MKKLWRGLLALMVGLSLLGGAPTTVQATTDIEIEASAAVAVEAQTGKVLYDQNAKQVLPIASMTKMLSLYLVREAVAKGQLQWQDVRTPDAATYQLSQKRELSNVPLRQDGQYTIEELYQAAWLYSANAATMVLADAVAGSQAAFVDLMRAKLKAWGVTDATIVNVTGLDNDALTTNRYPGSAADAQNQMAAVDVALVAKHLLTDYPDVLKLTAQPSRTFREGTSDAIKMPNYNRMLEGLSAAVPGLPVDGLKTGTTDRAGECFTGTVEKNGMRIITVVMHANGSGEDKRFVQTARLMNAVLASWKPLTITDNAGRIEGYRTIAVDQGKATTLQLKAAHPVTVVVPSDVEPNDLSYRYQPARGTTKRQVAAPVKQGQTVGTLTVGVKGDKLGYVGSAKGATVQLKTTSGTKKANVLVRMGRGLRQFFSDLF